MKLYNTSLDTIFAMSQGVPYYVLPMAYISVSESTGQFLMEKWAEFGLVDITIDIEKYNKNDLKEEIPRRILNGMYRYLERLNYNIKNWISLDTEYKQSNIYQTVLKHPVFAELELKAEKMLEIIKSNEEKYGIHVKTENIEKRTEELKNSIDLIMQGYEKDVKKYKEGAIQQAVADKIINDIVADVKVAP